MGDQHFLDTLSRLGGQYRRHTTEGSWVVFAGIRGDVQGIRGDVAATRGDVAVLSEQIMINAKQGTHSASYFCICGF